MANPCFSKFVVTVNICVTGSVSVDTVQTCPTLVWCFGIQRADMSNLGVVLWCPMCRHVQHGCGALVSNVQTCSTFTLCVCGNCVDMSNIGVMCLCLPYHANMSSIAKYVCGHYADMSSISLVCLYPPCRHV